DGDSGAPCDTPIHSSPVARGAYYMSSFDIDACNAYGVDTSTNALWRESLAGGGRITLVANSMNGVGQSPIANSTHVFSNGGSSLERVGKLGGDAEVLFTESINSGIAVDDDRVAFTAQSDSPGSMTGLVDLDLRTKIAQMVAPDVWALSLVRSGSDFF